MYSVVAKLLVFETGTHFLHGCKQLLMPEGQNAINCLLLQGTRKLLLNEFLSDGIQPAVVLSKIQILPEDRNAVGLGHS